MNPTITIVIANYNYGHFIADSIRSVLNQIKEFSSYVHLENLVAASQIELLVVDGGSTDDSVQQIVRLAGHECEIVNTRDNKGSHQWHKCERLTWISERDSGQSDAFNKGFSYAHGNFLVWLNADDVFFPGSFKVVLDDMAKHPECEWFTGSSVWCDSRLVVTKVFRSHRFSKMRVNSRTLTCGGPSSFFSKRLYNHVGGIDESLHFIMDNDLWYKFYFRCGATYRNVSRWVWAYRFHSESKMSGRIVDPDSERSKRNNERIQEEGRIQVARYGASNWFWRLTRKIPVSVVDVIVTLIKGMSWRRKSLNLICGELITPPKILLSNSIQEYLDGLCKLKADVYVFNNLWRKKFSDFEGVSFLDESYFDDAKKCALLIDNKGINVLYAQGIRSLIFFSRVRKHCRAVKPKLLGNCHTSHTWNSPIKSIVMIFLAGLISDGFVFISERTQRRWALMCKFFCLPTYHVPNPVVISRFMPKDAFCLNGRLVLGYVGSIRPMKNQKMIIEIVRLLRQQGIDAVAKIGGNTPRDGRMYRNLLEKSIVESELESYITFDGQVDYDDIPAWMREIDIYVCPSLAEVMPFSILEAMATGLPVVCNDVGAMHEQVRNGVNGYLIKDGDVNGYVEAIKKIATQEQLRRMGCASLDLVKQEFSTERYAERMKEVLC